jgi:hypothetical protein
MNEQQKDIYLAELGRHAGWALEARERMLAAATGEERHGALHQMLGHASVAARLLWPARGRKLERKARRRAEARAAQLRELLRIGEDHTLASELLADHVTRFDLSLDAWVADELDRIIVPEGSAAELVRWYDPEQDRFHVRGVAHSLGEVERALRDLRARVREARRSHGREATA